jgi:hypothetical protein
MTATPTATASSAVTPTDPNDQTITVQVQSVHRWMIYGFMGRHRLVKIETTPSTIYTALGAPGSLHAIRRGSKLVVQGHFTWRRSLFMADSIMIIMPHPQHPNPGKHGKSSGGGKGHQGGNNSQGQSPPSHGHGHGKGDK